MTGQEYIDATRELLDAPVAKDEYFDDDQLLIWINWGYRDLIKQTGYLYDSTNALDNPVGPTYRNALTLVQGQLIYPMPDMFFTIHPYLGVWYDDIKLEGTNLPKIYKEGMYDTYYREGSSPEKYTINYLDYNQAVKTTPQSMNSFSVFPLADASIAGNNLLRVHYTVYPGDITTSSEPVIRWDWEKALPFFGAAISELKRKETKQANVWKGLYMDVVEDITYELWNQEMDSQSFPDKPWILHDQ